MRQLTTTNCDEDSECSEPCDLSQEAQSNLRAKYEIGFRYTFGAIVDKKPIHECIAIAAFINSDLKFPPNTIYQTLKTKQWEFFRGLIWNDDPSCLLLNDKEGDNHDFGFGIEWADAFFNGPAGCMTKRSHFGNLQFLHAMATRKEESAEETKQNLMLWLEIMYKLACGNQGVSGNDQLNIIFPKDFDRQTDPSGSKTLRDLIMATTPSYKYLLLDRRALGICLHIVQDSYAVGHTQRRLCNCQDLAPRDSKGFIHFKPKTYGEWGPIRAFHTYKDQDERRHLHYDTIGDKEDIPIPRKLETFNKVIGARSAIDASIKLINYYHAKTQWDDGVRQFLSDDIFALDKDVQRANTQVDPEIVCTHSMHLHQAILSTQVEDGSCVTNGQNQSVDVGEDSYATGFTRKLNILESGLAEFGTTSCQPATRYRLFRQAPHGRTRSKLRIVLLGFTIILGFVAATALSAFLSAMCRKSVFRS